MEKLLNFIYIWFFICLVSNYFVVVFGQTTTCGSTTCQTAPDAFRKCFVFGGCNGNGCLYTKKTCSTTDKCKTLVSSSECNKNTGEMTCNYSDIQCNDNNPCTDDSCDSSIGCVFSPINQNDNNSCTIDGCGSDGVATHTPITCDDNNPCTTDSCDPSTGCVSVSNVDDNNKCTIDTCSPNGPINAPVSCPNKKFLDVLGLGFLCCPQICDPSTGGCIRDPNALSLPLPLCF
ncbi:hypothetical protein RB653_010006 [Dictyostelium firmibasis]|uniref:Uncharacterized protein n=1 Tax=Dictyostelium firmibasis TaxID=79012 RepID=A0AAN7TT37_9MYCE